MTLQFYGRTFEREQDRREAQAFAAAIGAALESKSVPDVSAFARRTVYADALEILSHEMALAGHAIFSPTSALVLGGPFLIFRIAVAFRVVHVNNRLSRQSFEVEFLHKKKHSRRVGKRAMLALACLGECDWHSASRVQRAAFLYGSIVREAHK